MKKISAAVFGMALMVSSAAFAAPRQDGTSSTAPAVTNVKKHSTRVAGQRAPKKQVKKNGMAGTTPNPKNPKQ